MICGHGVKSGERMRMGGIEGKNGRSGEVTSGEGILLGFAIL